MFLNGRSQAFIGSALSIFRSRRQDSLAGLDPDGPGTSRRGCLKSLAVLYLDIGLRTFGDSHETPSEPPVRELKKMNDKKSKENRERSKDDRRSSVVESVARGAASAAVGAAQFATRSAGHVVEGETRRKLRPAATRLMNQTQSVQTRAARRIDRLAHSVRRLGGRLERPDEAQTLARRLEETADYLRFRPSEYVAKDTIAVIRRSHIVPITGAVLAGFLAYKWISSRNRQRS